MDTWVEKFITGFIVIAVTLILYLFVMLVPIVYVSGECVRHGYFHSSVTWDFEMYCGKIVNQTEYLVPLYEVLEQK